MKVELGFLDYHLGDPSQLRILKIGDVTHVEDLEEIFQIMRKNSMRNKLFTVKWWIKYKVLNFGKKRTSRDL